MALEVKTRLDSHNFAVIVDIIKEGYTISTFPVHPLSKDASNELYLNLKGELEFSLSDYKRRCKLDKAECDHLYWLCSGNYP